MSLFVLKDCIIEKFDISLQLIEKIYKQLKHTTMPQFKHTVKQLEFLWDKYLLDIKKKGYVKQVYNQQLDKVVEILVPKPLTIESFCLFAEITLFEFFHYLNYKPSDNEDVNNEVTLHKLSLAKFFTRTQTFIRDYQIGGATANVLNANIVARLNSLTEKIEQQTTQPTETINIIIDGTKLDLS